MAIPRTNPLLAFGIVVGAASVYFGLLGIASPALEALKPLPEFAQVGVGVGLLYILPTVSAGLLQFGLTREVPVAAWWRYVQVGVAALLGPFIAASLVFWVWLAMGGTM
ncbi:MAG: hypothetical protein ACREUW_13110 [Burkholderiales bacterium]